MCNFEEKFINSSQLKEEKIELVKQGWIFTEYACCALHKKAIEHQRWGKSFEKFLQRCFYRGHSLGKDGLGFPFVTFNKVLSYW